MGIVESLSLFCEIMALLLVLHILMGKKFQFDVYTVSFIVFDIVLYRFIGMQILSDFMQVVIYAMFFVYLRKRFKNETFLKVAANTIISFFLVSGIQIGIYMILVVIGDIKIRIAVMEFVSFLIILLGMKIISVWKNKNQVFRYNETLKVLVLGCGVCFVVLMILCKIVGFSFLNSLLTVMILFVVMVFCQQWKAEKERNILQEREIRVLQQCNESFEHLIKDVRSRQHEFDNQIETIYSLQYVTDTYEELVRRQNEYAAHIIKENRFHDLLMLKCSSFIKGFLYYKFTVAEEKGIEIVYEINLNDFYNPFVEFDIQEIVGILFDNACEALSDETQPKKVDIKIESFEGKINIQVKNPAEYMSQKEIQYYLKQGHSSKGENRGLGLNNAWKIVKKYDGWLEIENIEKAEQNWVAVSALLKDVG